MSRNQMGKYRRRGELYHSLGSLHKVLLYLISYLQCCAIAVQIDLLEVAVQAID